MFGKATFYLLKPLIDKAATEKVKGALYP